MVVHFKTTSTNNTNFMVFSSSDQTNIKQKALWAKSCMIIIKPLKNGKGGVCWDEIDKVWCGNALYLQNEPAVILFASFFLNNIPTKRYPQIFYLYI